MFDEEKKFGRYIDYIDTYSNQIKYDKDKLDGLYAQISKSINEIRTDNENGRYLRSILSVEQFKLVTKWMKSDKFFCSLHPNQRVLLRKIVEDDKIPTNSDRDTLNEIRDKWIVFLR